MHEALDRARQVIEERLHEIEDESKKLRDALAGLVHQDGRKPARQASNRAPRGKRQSQLLASIEKHPDYKPGQHAKAMKVSPNQVYGLARKLQEDGKISKTAKGTYKIKKPKATGRKP